MSPGRRGIPLSVQRSLPYIKVLADRRQSRKEQLSILKHFPPHILQDIVEVLYYVSKGNISIKPDSVRKLQRYRVPLITLANLPNKYKRRNFIYKQKGAVLPVIASVIGG